MATCSRCHAPTSECVHGYTRAAPPKRRKKAKKKAGPYWTCVTRSGRTCGTKHRSSSAAYKHVKRLDLKSYRAGNGRPWDVEKRGT